MVHGRFLPACPTIRGSSIRLYFPGKWPASPPLRCHGKPVVRVMYYCREAGSPEVVAEFFLHISLRRRPTCGLRAIPSGSLGLEYAIHEGGSGGLKVAA